MKLYDLVSYFDLHKHLTAGNIKRQTHPEFPLAILNYTDKATYDRAWDDTTLRTRGLIYNTQTHDVVARPMEKIFNHNEPDAPSIPLDAPVEVTDKIDGSLGILYRYDGQWHVATRGSFTSEQAIRGTAILNRYAQEKPFLAYLDESLTPLVEVVFPENRIVLDYGDTEDLFYLCSVEIKTGKVLRPLEGAWWPGPVAQRFNCSTYAEALAAPPRENAEGYVIRSHFGTVKLKQQDYVELHKIVFGLNARVVWEKLKNSDDWAIFVSQLPEEFLEWVWDVTSELSSKKTHLVLCVWDDFAKIERMLGGGDYTRKEFAMVAKTFPNPAPLFMALDGNGDRIDEWAWNEVKPAGNWTPRGVVEDE